MRNKNPFMVLSIFLVFVILSAGCKKTGEQFPTEPDEPKPTAKFTIDPTNKKEPLTFTFKAEVGNYKELIWSFGDGNNGFDRDVTHTYLTTGTYKVILKALNKLGYWAQWEEKVTIRPMDIIDFTAEAQVDGSLKLQPSTLAEVNAFSWYTGIAAVGVPIATTASVNVTVPVTSNYMPVTLKIKTAKGSEVAHTKLVTVRGALNDVTVKGVTLSISNESPSGPLSAEGSSKLIDGNNATKFLLYDVFTSDFWIQQKVKNPIVVNAYTFVSGNDAKDRDPKTWDLVGSDDGVTWVKLDTQKDILSDVRTETRVYLFNNTKAYNYYRVNIKAIRSGKGIQITEWRLMSTL